MKYFVRTWDPELHTYTPQIGVPTGPYSLWELKQALRLLQAMGYSANRDDWCILVERQDERIPEWKKDAEPTSLYTEIAKWTAGEWLKAQEAKK